MKRFNLFTTAIISFLMITLWSFTFPESTGVRGVVSPIEAVQSVMLISGKDTLRHTPVNGSFSIEARAGIFQLLVDAQPGYKDILLERIVVEESRMTDVGELVLQKIIP